MTRVQKLKQILNQNMIARVLLYVAALLVPVMFYCELDYEHDIAFLEKIDVLSVLWLSFYSCILLFWTRSKRWWEYILIAAVIFANLAAIAFYCLAFLFGGILGPFMIILSALVPFAWPLLYYVGGYGIFAALWVLVLIVAVFIFWKVSQNRRDE